MDLNKKIQAFEFALTQMLRWGAELKPVVPEKSFTRLKTLKLLFFIAAVKNENGNDLLDIFDNFYALPNGPVESDIYNCITTDSLNYYTFKDFSFAAKKVYEDTGIDDELKSRINMSIAALKEKNASIVAYSAERLVALSHLWMVWQNSIQIAQILGKGSYRMDISNIRNNNQFFSL